MVTRAISWIKHCTATGYVWITERFGSISRNANNSVWNSRQGEDCVEKLCGQLSVRLISPTLFYTILSEKDAQMGRWILIRFEWTGRYCYRKKKKKTKEASNSEASVHSLCIQYAAFKLKIILIFVEIFKKKCLASVSWPFIYATD